MARTIPLTSVLAFENEQQDRTSQSLAQHSRWLRTVIFARLRDPHAVEEVVQEVALALVKGRSLPEDERQRAPWLYRVAVRQALLYRRQMGRRRKLHDAVRQVSQPPAAGVADPLAWLLADERRALVRQALGRLAARDREMLLLKYTEDWNYQQIAAHLGTTHAAVESRLHRARARLRQELAALSVVELNGKK